MEDVTIKYYNKNAKEYIDLTRDTAKETRELKFIKYLKKDSYILDLGCGSGKASKFFMNNGYRVCALDASIELAKLTSEYLGQQVICKRMEEIDFNNEFDGIYASASLLHIPKNKQKEVLKKLTQALKENGYMYVNYKYGNFEGIRDGRYYSDFTMEEIEKIIEQIRQLKIIEKFIIEDELGRGNKWINLIMKKHL